MKPVRLIRPVYFLWVIVPVTLYALFLIVGAPHMLISYSWRDDGQGFDPLAYRYYIRCTYHGPYGPITIHWPPRGECNWFLFRHEGTSTAGASHTTNHTLRGS